MGFALAAKRRRSSAQKEALKRAGQARHNPQKRADVTSTAKSTDSPNPMVEELIKLIAETEVLEKQKEELGRSVEELRERLKEADKKLKREKWKNRQIATGRFRWRKYELCPNLT
ncbi:hypothetical protein VNI00_003432 [Paramarasmius palmivorus]|uniref:Uncharacterized protein n=1 Tax=Paramarasmius palmivorus TaxID=297713 RepID=A0AAW0DU89_9AGAR